MTGTSEKPPGGGDRPPPLSPDDVTETIRRCLTAGSVVPTRHFRDQAFLRDYTIQDAINVLQWGEVSSEAREWSEKVGRWGYRIHGPDLEGDVLTVVVGIDPDRERVWLVTAF